MLADGAAVESVYRGPDGILEGLREGTVLLDMSTVEPQVSQSLESDVRARGACLLDAPVSGSTSTAESGQLTIMVGGDADALARVKPVLDALASRVFHLGPAGTGAAMKLAVNAVVFGLDVALSEGLVLAERAGVEPERAYDVFQASAIGAPLVTYKRANFLAPESTPTAFSLDLAAKDLGLITSLGDAVARPTGAGRDQSRTHPQQRRRRWAAVATSQRSRRIFASHPADDPPSRRQRTAGGPSHGRSHPHPRWNRVDTGRPSSVSRPGPTS